MVVQLLANVWRGVVRFAEALERRPEDDLRDQLDWLSARVTQLERDAAGPGLSA